MAKVMNDALAILRYLDEQGASPMRSASISEIAAGLTLSQPELDSADYYLLDSHYIDGDMGDDRWLTSAGLKILDDYRYQFPLSLRAERLMKAAVELSKTHPVEWVFAEHLAKDLHLSGDDCQDALVELADMGYIEDAADLSNRRPFYAFAVTAAGRNFHRCGYRRDPLTVDQQKPGVYIGSVSGGNVQAVGTMTGNMSQTVGDPVALRQELDALGQKLTDAVKAELSASALAEYSLRVQELKTALLSEQRDDSLIKQLATTLSWLADTEGTIALMLRLMPLVGQMLSLVIK